MKYIKFILLAILFAFAFILESNDFQNYIPYGFVENYPCFSISFKDNSERTLFWKELIDITNQNNEEFVAYSIKNDSLYNANVTLYGDEAYIKKIANEYDIQERTYSSFSAGNTTVKIEDKKLLTENNTEFINSFYYLGTKDDADKLYAKLSEKYEVYYQSDMKFIDDDFVFRVIWILILTAMVLLTFFEVSLRKKEMHIRHIMGETVAKSIIKNIIIEIVIIICLFFAIRTMVFSYYDGDFRSFKSLMFTMMAIFMDSIIYIYWALGTSKYILGVGGGDRILLGSAYLVKLLTTIMVVVMVGMQFKYLQSNIEEFYDEKSKAEKLSGYAYLKLVDDEILAITDAQESMDRWNNDYCAIYDSIYEDNYNEYKPIILSPSSTDKYTMIEANHNANIMLNNYPEIVDQSKDVIVLYPSSKEKLKDEFVFDCESTLSFEFKGEEYSIEYIPYSGRRTCDTIVYDYAESLFEVSSYTDPILMYINSDRLSSMMNGSTYGENTLYKLSEKDIDSLNQYYQLDSRGFSLEYTDYNDYNSYCNSFIQKLIRLLSSAIVLILITHILIIKIVCELHFKVNAKGILISKLMGNSLLKRHKGQIILLLTEDGIVFIGACVTVIILGQIINAASYILIFLLVIIADLAINILGVLKVEKKNSVKTLKGGAL